MDNEKKGFNVEDLKTKPIDDLKNISTSKSNNEADRTAKDIYNIYHDYKDKKLELYNEFNNNHKITDDKQFTELCNYLTNSYPYKDHKKQLSNLVNELKEKEDYKKENWIEKFAVLECSNDNGNVVGESKFNKMIGTFFDFEITTEKDTKRNIDLLSYDKTSKTLRIVELKAENNDKDYFKAVMELLDYYIRTKAYDLNNCPLINHPYLKEGNYKVEKIKMSILAHEDSEIVKNYKYRKYPYINKLIDELFEIEFFEYNTEKDEVSKEDVVIKNINKPDNYLNSKSEKEYLNEIGYNLSLLEKLAIVYNSKYLNLENKTDIQKDIIKNNENLSFDSLDETEKSKLQTIKDSIDSITDKIESFKIISDDEFYTFTLYGENYDFDESKYYNDEQKYKSYEDVIAAIKNTTKFKFKSAFIEKLKSDKEHSVGRVILNTKCDIVDIFTTEKDCHGLYLLIYENIPVRFKKGDIVCMVDEPKVPLIYESRNDEIGAKCYYVNKKGEIDSGYFDKILDMEFYKGDSKLVEFTKTLNK